MVAPLLPYDPYAPRIRLGNKPGAFLASRTAHARKLGSLSPGPPPVYNATIANLYEDLGDGSTERSHARMAQSEGVTVRVWQMQPASPTDLIHSYTDILGGCQYTPTNTGHLARELPLADPVHGWIFATDITSIEGYGTYGSQAASAALEAPAFPNFTFWEFYRLTVESHQRPYALLQDASIPLISGSWYPETADGGAGDVATAFQYVMEQNRYTTAQEIPQNDYVTRKIGQMVCNSSDAQNGTTFQDEPRVFLPNSLYVVKWFFVPLRYVISGNSYLPRWRGRVNQNNFTGPEGRVFTPGQLLFLNYSYEPYTPPVQKLVALGGKTNVVSTEKFVHLTLTFLFTNRSIASAVGSTPTNKNYVLAGHNLLPTGNDLAFRAFQTNTTVGAGAVTYGPPLFLSAPLEILFTDPDAPNAI